MVVALSYDVGHFSSFNSFQGTFNIKPMEKIQIERSRRLFVELKASHHHLLQNCSLFKQRKEAEIFQFRPVIIHHLQLLYLDKSHIKEKDPSVLSSFTSKDFFHFQSEEHFNFNSLFGNLHRRKRTHL